MSAPGAHCEESANHAIKQLKILRTLVETGAGAFPLSRAELANVIRTVKDAETRLTIWKNEAEQALSSRALKAFQELRGSIGTATDLIGKHGRGQKIR
jgi:hypothetical protein